jgi:hypothetical protein
MSYELTELLGGLMQQPAAAAAKHEGVKSDTFKLT